MGLGKQSKVLNKSQIEMISNYLRSKRNGLRNQTIFLLSVKSGLRAKEISQLRWKHVLQSDGETIDDYINLPNSSTKGNSGRIIPLHKDSYVVSKVCLPLLNSKAFFNITDTLFQYSLGFNFFISIMR